jgi:5-methylcytosine-specific restriction enzyme A
MTRSVPEWIGKSDDTPVPPRVRLRVFERCGGRCHISGRKITAADKWECDHVTPLIEGGENRESNLAPALVQEHRKKTRSEVAKKKKDARVRKKFLGQHKSKQPMQGGRGSKFKKKINGEVVRRD